MENNTAVILSNGMLDNNHAKTAHGLIRGTERFRIVGVIDSKQAGKDAGEVMDGKKRNIPVFESMQQALSLLHQKPDYCIIGVATSGGKLPPQMLASIADALSAGIHIVNGLHEQLASKPQMLALAKENGAEILDIRKPRRFEDLQFWTGAIYSVPIPIIAVLGMDCATGKRTTARFLVQACREHGISAEMIYTGQTGWMQGGKYGFIFDTTPNDFISGEIENAILHCFRESNPKLIFIEGQSSLRNPAGPCGSEFLISGNAKKVVLVTNPKQKYFDDDPSWGEIPSLQSEIELIKMYGSEVIAIAINTQGCRPEELSALRDAYERQFKIPVLLPAEEGLSEFIPYLKHLAGQ